MNREEIVATTKRFLSEEFEVDETLIEDQKNLKDTLELDSLDYVDLVVVIEENFGFKTSGEDFKSISTFEDFYNFVERKLAAMA
ncbi:MAG TPA: phosphopantetheine-binding protein [Bacteroidia bacterium]|nr:acyl carrier protein [Bacteroidia bacterium]QQR95010.1 MAG: acyl carrier protein [Bacteroidota bacterium]MBP7714401.1 acyl carrier protein [Bacteroidia bacterium]MBP8669191.1 acyl carrier protein [Bacteroidia bacterium]HOZ89546.1 phosphopantetheine-binding protein [Bacteroidia bacterium]